VAQQWQEWHADPLGYAETQGTQGTQGMQELQGMQGKYGMQGMEGMQGKAASTTHRAAGQGADPTRPRRAPEAQAYKLPSGYGPGQGHRWYADGEARGGASHREGTGPRPSQWLPHEAGFPVREGRGVLLASAVETGLGLGGGVGRGGGARGRGRRGGMGGESGNGWDGWDEQGRGGGGSCGDGSLQKEGHGWLASAIRLPSPDCPPPAVRRSDSHIYPQAQAHVQAQAEAQRDAMHRSLSLRHEVRPARPGPGAQGPQDTALWDTTHAAAASHAAASHGAAFHGAAPALTLQQRQPPAPLRGQERLPTEVPP